MFRKYDFAAGEWDEDAPARCALRQRDILQNAARTVRPGGYLLYSTCTFSPEENEQTVETFLTEHPDFVLCPVAEPVAQVTAPGIGLPLARRFYPHLAPGEGQFLALLRRSETAAEGRGICYTTSARPLSAADRKTVETFLTDTLATDRLPCTLGESVAFLPMPGGEAFPVPPRFVMSAGVTVGRLEKGRLTPHHQLFSALGHAFFRQTEWWGAEERLLAAYLHGEGFQVRQDNGWGCVLVRGCALGGYKAVDGMAKNHYPKGLRI